ncbi:MAG: LytR C-terminal domain-containing protein [Acidimicrobiales bacterium]|nr:LytR C-terminal domain-containing protein [Acidimicrobiales bacterium]MCB9392563.1 LytR C-terminal domain-containing protein [Acidimicrobiaceae bacterium]
MRKVWPSYLAVVVIGLLVGTVIAGGPGSDAAEPFEPTSGLDGDEPTSTTDADVSTDTTEADDDPVETTSPATTEAAPVTTEAAVTTTPATTEAAPATSLAIRDRAEVRVVVANGDGRPGLATANSDRLAALGYPAVVAGDVPEVDVTLVYYRLGFEVEALRIRDDLQTPSAAVGELPESGITSSDADGDIVVVLGPDALP